MWFSTPDSSQFSTPALAVYPDRISTNIKQTLDVVANKTERLCPHVKTHKCGNILQLFVNAGITQFKCSSIDELQLLVRNPATNFALLAKQPVGPDLDHVVSIAAENQNCNVAAIVDSEQTLDELLSSAIKHDIEFEVLLDINNGMDRTGIRASDEAFDLYRRLSESKQLRPGGLHVYDGHIHDSDASVRKQNVEAAMEEVLQFRSRLLDAGFDVPRLITGGTPSFPIHAEHSDRICSPGTPALWDAGYAHNYPDLPFVPAAVLLTRVISKLERDTYCLDLGYKSISSEMRPPRAKFLSIDVVEEVAHSEEHLVIRVADGETLRVGQVVFALPWHICPTVARHSELLVVEEQRIVDRWRVSRDRVPPRQTG